MEGGEHVTPKFVKPAESLMCTKYRMLLVVEAFRRMLFSNRKYSSTSQAVLSLSLWQIPSYHFTLILLLSFPSSKEGFLFEFRT